MELMNISKLVEAGAQTHTLCGQPALVREQRSCCESSAAATMFGVAMILPGYGASIVHCVLPGCWSVDMCLCVSCTYSYSAGILRGQSGVGSPIRSWNWWRPSTSASMLRSLASSSMRLCISGGRTFRARRAMSATTRSSSLLTREMPTNAEPENLA